MAKRLTTTHANAPDPAPPIFVTLIKCKSDELVYIEYEREGLKSHVEMEDATKQRPVDEFYRNMEAIALHILKQAELPIQRLPDVRATGIKLKYDGPGNMASAQLQGWFQLKMSAGGYALPLPFKTLGSHVTSQTDGEPEYPVTYDEESEQDERQEEMTIGENGPQMADGSNRVRHSDDATKLIRRQIELAVQYIDGQRAAQTLFDIEEESTEDTDERPRTAIPYLDNGALIDDGPPSELEEFEGAEIEYETVEA